MIVQLHPALRIRGAGLLHRLLGVHRDEKGHIFGETRCGIFTAVTEAMPRGIASSWCERCAS